MAMTKACAFLIPHYCLLCHERIEEARDRGSFPLCDNCREKLSGIHGERCSICGRELFAERDICFPCRGKDRSCSELYPLFTYSGAPGALLKSYKSGKRSSLAPFWAELMMRVIAERWPGRVVVPVPPRPEKIKKREWDQIEAIVAVIEKNGFPVRRILRRAESLQQKRLNRAMRKENARNAYSLAPGPREPLPDAVVLIDDVCTTGATIESCAKALRDAGVRDIAALVLAAD